MSTLAHGRSWRAAVFAVLVLFGFFPGCGGGGGGNGSPVITSITATPSNVSPGGNCTVACQASDPDGDALSYEWSASCGTISASGNSVTWTAPTTTGTGTLTCTVSDGHGGTAAKSVSISVSINHPPTITSLTAAPQEVPVGGDSTVTCVASDPDGDALSHNWSSAFGTVTGSGATVTWTAPASRGSYEIICTVKDGRGGIVSRAASITVNATPVIESLAAAPSEVGPGGNSTITCQASDAEGDTLSYEWTASAGTVTGSGSSATWTAPTAVGAYTVTCTVSDGKGNTVSQSVSIPVNVTNIVVT